MLADEHLSEEAYNDSYFILVNHEGHQYLLSDSPS